MIEKIKSLLYMVDLIGISPQLLILKNKRYKSILSSSASFLIIILSLIFAIISISEYLKFDSPSIIYARNNDEETERSIFLNETPLMFQMVNFSTIDVGDSVAFFEADYFIIYDNGSVFGSLLTIEKCELGSNINSKYLDFFEKKFKFGRKIEEFYCFSSKDGNHSLFYQPNIGQSFVNLLSLEINLFDFNEKFLTVNLHINIKKNNIYTPDDLQTLVVSENDLIDHNNKKNPISKNYIYRVTAGFSSLEYTQINYNFQYVKYETDDNLFYSNSKTKNGMSFSDMMNYRNIRGSYDLNNNFQSSNYSRIGTIQFGINKSNFDHYRRIYQKLQSLLADVMSVVSLLFEIGRLVSSFLCEKKMSGDIISSLLEKNKNYSLTQQNHNINNLFKNKENNRMSSSERKDIKQESINKSRNLRNTDYFEKNDEIILNKSIDIKKNDKNEKINKIGLNKNLINEINYFNIIKSYLCFKDKKTELINLCHDIIIEDMSIESILKRIYDLEQLYSSISSIKKENSTLNKNERFKEINNNIHKIKKEDNRHRAIKRKKSNNYLENDKKENSQIQSTIIY